MVVEYTIRPDGCWDCLVGTRQRGGHYRGYFDGRMQEAHHATYAAAGGLLPAGQILRHTCDNAACVNPAHLVPGTYQDNADDMHARGRFARGERNGRARLTAAAVRLIRSSSAGVRPLARALKVSPKAVRKVRHGETWTHV